MEKTKAERKQKLSFRFVPTRHVIQNFQKIKKKFRSLKNTVMASFQVERGYSKGREREEIKIIIPFRSCPTRNRKLQENSKIIEKIKKKKYYYGVISSQSRLEKA